ncbi:MAG: undecaprenyl-diphosphate phosphatase [Alphaproteobacteria bacterium]|nr:undecaprenyl-diphosphate phosphatase [Alphaproteobacteria bacterium]|tara:strand:+ start:905 stop:1708 length:804 start_codon:yes stop_codon:yes gene_type:complete
MPLFEIVVLAIIQGVTEFIPVSSSGHLRVGSEFLDLSENTLIIDVAVHVGTLFAVALYFWRDLVFIAVGTFETARGRKHDGGRLAGYLIIATIPIVIAGFFGEALLENSFRTLVIVGWTTVGFGILLFLGDRLGMTILRIEHLSIPHAAIIGLAQILALVPGTSRSGVTITAARFLGYDRREAARFSMLLSIPAIAGAGILIGMRLFETDDPVLTRDAFVAAVLSFVTALVAIVLFLRWLRFAGFGPFVIYRIILGGLILAWAYGLF